MIRGSPFAAKSRSKARGRQVVAKLTVRVMQFEDTATGTGRASPRTSSLSQVLVATVVVCGL
ncbi:hypothetical protein E2C01_056929 [Portunus trituberculatus]|uniref:Uncharacterized protein n=1 Tax=Portunus trituberculatus TaxID=210409 RepID=A0A5B7H0X4_PORTR|nr:hypothetical protein [Portunus trituberculatus]